MPRLPKKVPRFKITRTAIKITGTSGKSKNNRSIFPLGYFFVKVAMPISKNPIIMIPVETALELKITSVPPSKPRLSQTYRNTRAIARMMMIFIVKDTTIPRVPNSPTANIVSLDIVFSDCFFCAEGISSFLYSCTVPRMYCSTGVPQYLQNLPVGASSFPHLGQNISIHPFRFIMRECYA